VICFHVDMKPIKFREHRGTLEDSMKTCVDVGSLEELECVVRNIYGEGKVTVESYVYDGRIGWDTQLVCMDGSAVGFTSQGF
jgi:hypothetical protein